MNDHYASRLDICIDLARATMDIEARRVVAAREADDAEKRHKNVMKGRDEEVNRLKLDHGAGMRLADELDQTMEERRAEADRLQKEGKALNEQGGPREQAFGDLCEAAVDVLCAELVQPYGEILSLLLERMEPALAVFKAIEKRFVAVNTNDPKLARRMRVAGRHLSQVGEIRNALSRIPVRESAVDAAAEAIDRRYGELTTIVVLPAAKAAAE